MQCGNVENSEKMLILWLFRAYDLAGNPTRVTGNNWCMVAVVVVFTFDFFGGVIWTGLAH